MALKSQYNRRIVVVNRFFAPDHSATAQLLSDLAFTWAQEGRDVTVVTSRQLYGSRDASLPPRETLRGVRVERVAMTRFGRYGLIGRTVDLLTFHVTAGIALWRILGRDSVVIAKTDPPLISIVAAIVARMRGATLVNWLQDVFPEVAERVGIGTGVMARMGHGLLRMARNASLRSAARNVVLGERMAGELAKAGISSDRVAIVHNWADGAALRPVPPDENGLRRAWGLMDRFVVCYSGNLGRAHDYQTFIDAMTRLEARPDQGHVGRDGSTSRRVHWLFIGGGIGLAQLKAESKRLGLTAVSFEPYQDASRLSESLSAADVHLVSLRPCLEGLIVPSKYYGIAAAGRPAIFIGDADGEVARMLRASSSGHTVAEGDGAGLAATIASLATDPARTAEMGRNARLSFGKSYDRPKAIAAWSSVIDAIEPTVAATAVAGTARLRLKRPSAPLRPRDQHLSDEGADG